MEDIRSTGDRLIQRSSVTPRQVCLLLDTQCQMSTIASRSVSVSWLPWTLSARHLPLLVTQYQLSVMVAMDIQCQTSTTASHSVSAVCRGCHGHSVSEVYHCYNCPRSLNFSCTTWLSWTLSDRYLSLLVTQCQGSVMVAIFHYPRTLSANFLRISMLSQTQQTCRELCGLQDQTRKQRFLTS